ncbi:MAG: class I SAM-dependent methyltransferase [Candidatus Poseidoniales archaeon]
MKEEGRLITRLKPMPHGDLIAFPVTTGTEKLRFKSKGKIDHYDRLIPLMGLPPAKWEIIGQMVVFPKGSHAGDEDYDWAKIAEVFGCEKVGIQAEINSGDLRKPQLKLIHGADGWVSHRENFVTYEFDATKVMFSSGNITERRRMGQLDCESEIIIDAYCGIGYYSIPFLARANAAHVHACEMNPDSIEALKKGLLCNRIQEKCTIYRGDNQLSLPRLQGIADRVILGLIPSSEATWNLAVDCLKPEGGIIHVHMNVDERKLDEWMAQTIDVFSRLSGKNATAIHLEKVKWYCPHIRHVVLDIQIE